MDIRRLFTEHPASVNESYIEHLIQASRFGTRLVCAGLACIIHAWLPFLFVNTASDAVERLHERMITKRRALARSPATGASSAER